MKRSTSFVIGLIMIIIIILILWLRGNGSSANNLASEDQRIDPAIEIAEFITIQQ